MTKTFVEWLKSHTVNIELDKHDKRFFRGFFELIGAVPVLVLGLYVDVGLPFQEIIALIIVAFLFLHSFYLMDTVYDFD